MSYQVQGLLCGELLLVEGRDERLLVAHVEALHDAMKNDGERWRNGQRKVRRRAAKAARERGRK
jgi:hypothetical protein